VPRLDKSSLLHQIERGYVSRKSKVNTATFDQLTEKYNFSEINFLCIDTEGFDYEVLKFFNFEKFQPEVILYESKTLEGIKKQ